MARETGVHRVIRSGRDGAAPRASVTQEGHGPRHEFSLPEREAVYRAIFERRDVRRNFLPTPIPDQILTRVLTAAQMQEADRATIDDIGIPAIVLMENAGRQVVAAMIQFARTAKRPDGDGEPSVIGAIRIPQALRFIGQDYPVMQDSDVILLGSPLYDDPKDQPFSMRPNHIPGDGHLTKARNVTPYGIKGQDSLLAKRRVHIAFLDNWKQDDHHSYFVQRFWTLFVEGQGGQLSSFTHDLPTLFQRVKSNAASPKHDYKVEATDKLEMILMRPPTIKRQTSIYERPVSTTPLPPGVLRQASRVEVGITWECGKCDLDLYGQREPGSTTIWFLSTQTKDGQYFRDFRTSPRSANGYETLAFHVPVDLNHLLLAVNFYNGSSPGGVKGEVRISFNGQTCAVAFHVLAQEGNGGVGRQETLTARQANNPAWLVIDPMEVLGVRSSATVVSQR